MNERYLITLTGEGQIKSYWNCMFNQWETDRSRGSRFMSGDAGRTANELAAVVTNAKVGTEKA